MPYFSIIIPTHKRSSLLLRAIKSIKEHNTFDDFELIVVSDISDSATDAVCTELLGQTDIHIRRNGLAGPAESRNLALSLAKGRYVMFLDDDDAWHPELLAQLHSVLAIQNGISVYFNCSIVKESRGPEGVQNLMETELNLSERLNLDIFLKNQVHMSCFAFPRHILTGIDFDCSMRAYEDWDYLLSIMERGMPIHLPILGSRVFEVDDATSDRRGNSLQARDFNAVLDYLYVYRRHPAPNADIRTRRTELLKSHGIQVDESML